MAAAARALSITEVLEQICAYNDATTNVQAGQVSRGWSEIALKFVWSSIDDIVPLVSTLSPLKVSPDSGLVFADRCPTLAWHRFAFYAKFVKHLNFTPIREGSGMFVRKAVFDEIARTRPMLALLPRLETMKFTIACKLDNTYLPYAVLLFHEGIESFTLQTTYDSILDAIGLQALLRDISMRLHKMKVLHLHTGNVATTQAVSFFGENMFLGYLSAMPSLEHLHMDYIMTPTIFGALAVLPRLRYLFFTKSCVYIGTPKTWPSPDPPFPDKISGATGKAFASLKTLGLQGSVGQMLDILKTDLLSSHVLKVLLYITEPYTLEELLLLTCKLHTTDMTKLSLLWFYALATPQVGPAMPHVHIEQLMPICNFAHLTSFLLECFEPVSISDVDFGTFTSALPNLSFLKMAWTSIAPPEVATTLKVLVPLTQACPKLRFLQIFVDATSANLPSITTLPVAVSPFPNLKTLRVGTSPIEEDSIIQVAAYLSHLLQSAEVFVTGNQPVITTYKNRNIGAQHAVAVERHELWTKVGKSLSTLVPMQNAHRDALKKLQVEKEELLSQMKAFHRSGAKSTPS